MLEFYYDFIDRYVDLLVLRDGYGLGLYRIGR